VERSTDALPPPSIMPDLAARLARVRVPLGFVASAAALWLAHPTWTSMGAGAAVAVAGEAVRVWASGHLEKGREVTASGPYRLTGHPLYLGSSLIGAGFAVASHSVAVGVIAVLYLGATLGAAIRSEEAGLRAKFGREYVEYRAGRVRDATRPFSLARAVRNREHRAVAGLAGVLILLALKTWLLL
jgi:protein-S-isoprenylcysteine O-methyltransferase Ste14